MNTLKTRKRLKALELDKRMSEIKLLENKDKLEVGIIGELITELFLLKKYPVARVLWSSLMVDKGLPYDIKVVRFILPTVYLEVKTTSQNSPNINISTREFNTMMNSKSWRLVRVDLIKFFKTESRYNQFNNLSTIHSQINFLTRLINNGNYDKESIRFLKRKEIMKELKPRTQFYLNLKKVEEKSWSYTLK